MAGTLAQEDVERAERVLELESADPAATRIKVQDIEYEIWDAYPSEEGAEGAAAALRSHTGSAFPPPTRTIAIVRDLGQEAGRLRYAVFIAPHEPLPLRGFGDGMVVRGRPPAAVAREGPRGSPGDVWGSLSEAHRRTIVEEVTRSRADGVRGWRLRWEQMVPSFRARLRGSRHFELHIAGVGPPPRPGLVKESEMEERWEKMTELQRREFLERASPRGFTASETEFASRLTWDQFRDLSGLDDIERRMFASVVAQFEREAAPARPSIPAASVSGNPRRKRTGWTVTVLRGFEIMSEGEADTREEALELGRREIERLGLRPPPIAAEPGAVTGPRIRLQICPVSRMERRTPISTGPCEIVGVEELFKVPER